MRKTQLSFQPVAFSVVKCINASYELKFSLSPQNFGLRTARVTSRFFRSEMHFFP